jgi:hypothetical protein
MLKEVQNHNTNLEQYICIHKKPQENWKTKKEKGERYTSNKEKDIHL